MLRHRRKHSKAYGVAWDESQSSPTCARIGQGQSAAAATKLPDNLMVLQSLMRSCLINDAGVVQYYTGATDRTKKEDGVTPSVLTGADGQVVVEIPLGWLKYSYANSIHQWIVSKEQFNGAIRLDAFYKNDAWVKNRYMGAYEGVLYDTSESKYINGLYLPSDADYKMSFADNGVADDTITSDTLTHPFTKLEAGVDKIVVSGSAANDGTYDIKSVTDTVITLETGSLAGTTVNDVCVIQVQRDWTASTGDKLASVSGKAPINQGTRANFRAVAKNRGTGWRQSDYGLVSAIQLFYLVEYASWYSQSMIGAGLTNFGSTDWLNRNNRNPIEATGLSNSLGNASGGIDNGTNALGSYMSYRAIEHFWGDIWAWVEGINILFGSGDDYTGQPYVSNKDTDFADDITTNYTALAETVPGKIGTVAQNGYQKTLGQQRRGFLPASVGGSLSTYITDYYYQNSGWHVAMLGGSAGAGADAGAAYWHLYVSLGSTSQNVGSRPSW